MKYIPNDNFMCSVIHKEEEEIKNNELVQNDLQDEKSFFSSFFLRLNLIFIFKIFWKVSKKLSRKS